MDIAVLYYLLAAILIVVGFAGTILPALPGTPLIFVGMLLAAWAGHFERVGVVTLVVLGVLAAVAFLLDFIAGLLGAKRVGASGAAIWGAAIGTLVGLFFGIPGLLLGPFVGAVVGELASGGSVVRSANVGVGTWLGLLFGAIAKIALSFAMLGIFAFAMIF